MGERNYLIHDELKELRKEAKKEKAMEQLGNLLESMKSGEKARLEEEEDESDSLLEDSSGQEDLAD